MRRTFFALAGILLAMPAAIAAPARILSLNLCADQLVIGLAPVETITSISYLARDCRISAACAAAAEIPINYGSAEEMLAQAPDLVIAGRYTTRNTIAIAHRLGLAVLDLDVPNTIEAVREEIRMVAAALGQSARGAAMIGDLDRRLGALPVIPDGPRPVAAVYETNGFTVGKNSLIDEILRRAGFDNLSVRLEIDNYPSLPLEILVANQPDLLILEARDDARPSLGGAMLRHPVLKGGFPEARRITVPQKLWLCGGPPMVDALELLAAARLRIARAAP